MTLETYQKFVNFRALHAEVQMCGYSTQHHSDFVENVWEYQLNFRVMFDDEMAQGRKSRRQKKKKLKDAKQKNTEERWTNMDKL
jgi:hypothetical protein